jgi:twinkle protein
MKCLADVKYKRINEVMKNSIETGFRDLYKHIYHLKQEEITIMYGRNGEGKSTVASQILAHHINQGKKAYLFSGELSANKIQSWLYKQIVGGNRIYYDEVKTKYDIIWELKEEVVQAVKTWHKGRLYIYENDINNYEKKTNMLFVDMNKLANEKPDVELFIIDNMMAALMVDATKEYADQANFVQKCKDFAIDKKKHVIILAHPTKASEELNDNSTSGNLDKRDISGSNNIPNKADNIIAVERIWRDEADHTKVEMFLTSLKDRWNGDRQLFKYKFSKASLRFYNDTTSENVGYDWKQYLPHQKAIEGSQEVEWVTTNDAPF